MPTIRRVPSPEPLSRPVSTVRRSEPLLPLIPVVLIIASLLYYAGLGQFSSDSAEFRLLAMAGALFVYLLTMVNLQFGVAILILAVGLSPELTLMGVGNLRIEDFILPILLVAWSTRLVEHSEPFVPTSLKAPILAFLGAGIVASLAGLALYDLPLLRGVFYLGKTFEYFLIFLLLINVVKTIEEANAYVMLILLTGLVVSIEGILGPKQELTGFADRRIHGPAGETGNIMGGYLMQIIALSLGLLLNTTSGLKRLFSLACLGLGFTAFMMTLSRTSYVALAVGLIAYGILKRRVVLVGVLVSFVALSTVAPESVLGRWGTLSSMFLEGQPPPSWQARVLSWQDLSNAALTSPLFGRGVGYYDLGYSDNEYMRVLSEEGILGLAAFLWLLIAIGRLAIPTADRYARDPELTGYAHGFLIVYIGMLVHSMGATSFTTIRTMEGFIVLLSLRVVIDHRYAEWYPESPAVPPREPLIVAPMLRTIYR